MCNAKAVGEHCLRFEAPAAPVRTATAAMP